MTKSEKGRVFEKITLFNVFKITILEKTFLKDDLITHLNATSEANRNEIHFKANFPSVRRRNKNGPRKQMNP